MVIEGKRALVTGGAHRVGKAIVMMLAQAGADTAFTYLSSGEEARRTIMEVEALGRRGVAVACDVTDWSEVSGMARSVEAALGGVDILVNSAGLFRRTPFPAENVSLWQRVTRASIDGTFFVCNAIAPGMLERGSGAIVNIVDLAAWHPWPGFAAHAVGKAGMLALTRQLAVELSPSVRTNAVAAGPVLPPEGLSENRQAEIASSTLLRHWGVADDVAEAVRYLVEADYVVGEVLTVDGGERLGHVKQ